MVVHHDYDPPCARRGHRGDLRPVHRPAVACLVCRAGRVGQEGVLKPQQASRAGPRGPPFPRHPPGPAGLQEPLPQASPWHHHGPPRRPRRPHRVEQHLEAARGGHHRPASLPALLRPFDRHAAAGLQAVHVPPPARPRRRPAAASGRLQGPSKGGHALCDVLAHAEPCAPRDEREHAAAAAAAAAAALLGRPRDPPCRLAVDPRRDCQHAAASGKVAEGSDLRPLLGGFRPVRGHGLGQHGNVQRRPVGQSVPVPRRPRQLAGSRHRHRLARIGAHKLGERSRRACAVQVRGYDGVYGPRHGPVGVEREPLPVGHRLVPALVADADEYGVALVLPRAVVRVRHGDAGQVRLGDVPVFGNPCDPAVAPDRPLHGPDHDAGLYAGMLAGNHRARPAAVRVQRVCGGAALGIVQERPPVRRHLYVPVLAVPDRGGHPRQAGDALGLAAQVVKVHLGPRHHLDARAKAAHWPRLDAALPLDAGLAQDGKLLARLARPRRDEHGLRYLRVRVRSHPPLARLARVRVARDAHLGVQPDELVPRHSHAVGALDGHGPVALAQADRDGRAGPVQPGRPAALQVLVGQELAEGRPWRLVYPRRELRDCKVLRHGRAQRHAVRAGRHRAGVPRRLDGHVRLGRERARVRARRGAPLAAARIGPAAGLRSHPTGHPQRLRRACTPLPARARRRAAG